MYVNNESIKDKKYDIEEWATTGLAHYIENCWQSARDSKIEQVEPTMVKAMRLYAGKYSQTELNAIREIGHPDVYIKLIALKCRAALSWINEISNQAAEKLWTIQPSPIPELSPDIKAGIQKKILNEMMDDISEFAMSGVEIPPENLSYLFSAHAENSIDKISSEIFKEAKERALKMEQKVEDVLVEGNYFKEMKRFNKDLTIFPSAILKWPVFSNTKQLAWKKKKNKYELEVTEDVKPFCKRTNPFDFYPDPASVEIGDSWTIERHRITRKELKDMKGVPGFNDDNIDKALASHDAGLMSDWLWTDSERAYYQQKNLYSVLRNDRVDAIEFWGWIRGEWLNEWGYESDEDEEPIDDNEEYYVCAWKIGRYVIKAVVNYDTMEKCPYHTASWSPSSDGIWGQGIPELIEPEQRMVNTCARAIAYNSAMASGPLTEVDSDRIPDKFKLWPNRIFYSTSAQIKDSPAVRYYNVPLVAPALIEIYKFFSTLADEVSGIPSYAHGNAGIGGAGKTASGLSMFMEASGRLINDVVGNVSQVSADIVNAVYHYIMQYDENDSIKGDLFVSVKGSTGVLTKQQNAVRQNELLNLITGNQLLSQIAGAKEIGRMLRDVIRSTGIDPGEIGEEDELSMELNKYLEQRQSMFQPQQQQNPQTLDLAGQPVSGQDFNLFQGVKQ